MSPGSSLLVSAVYRREHLLELAGEMSLVSMPYVLKTVLNLVLGSSWPLHPISHCVISGTGLQVIS